MYKSPAVSRFLVIGAQLLVQRSHETRKVHLELLGRHARPLLGLVAGQLLLDVEHEVVLDPPRVIGPVGLRREELVDGGGEERRPHHEEEVGDGLLDAGQGVEVEAETRGKHVRQAVESLQTKSYLIIIIKMTVIIRTISVHSKGKIILLNRSALAMVLMLPRAMLIW